MPDMTRANLSWLAGIMQNRGAMICLQDSLTGFSGGELMCYALFAAFHDRVSSTTTVVPEPAAEKSEIGQKVVLRRDVPVCIFLGFPAMQIFVRHNDTV